MPISVILGIAAAALVVVVVVKFGKAILKVALILVVLVLGCWLAFRGVTIEGIAAEGGSLDNVVTIARAVAPRGQPQPVQSPNGYWKGFWAGVLAGGLGAVALAACWIAGVYWLRWKLGARGAPREQRQRVSQRKAPRVAYLDQVNYLSAQEAESRPEGDLVLEEWGF